MKNISQEFDALLKHLVILSYDKETQLELIGSGEENIAGEMAINFCISFDYVEDFYMSQLIRNEQKIAIKDFYEYINDSNNGLLDSKTWTEIRKKASELLKILNGSHLQVELDKTGTFWETKLLNKTNSK